MNVVVGRRNKGSGEGPPCPANPEHGNLYKWEDGTWYCPTHDHGGNGKFFTDKEAHGEYEQTERDKLDVPDGKLGDERLLEIAAQEVIDGKTTLDLAVVSITEITSLSTAAARESLTLMISTIKNEGVSVAEKRKQVAKDQAAAKAAPKASGRRLEHVDGADFQKVVKKYGLTSKQAAEATGNAGMGKSATYVYILLHQGASVNLFDRFKEAIEEYAENMPEEAEAEAKPKKKTAKATKTTAKAASKPAAKKTTAKKRTVTKKATATEASAP